MRPYTVCADSGQSELCRCLSPAAELAAVAAEVIMKDVIQHRAAK